MKGIRFSVAALFALVALASAAKGLLPSQVYRRGLTNEQIDFIMQKRPNAELRMTQRDWQGMRFELCRYHNITNWCDMVNEKAGFAEMLITAQESTNRLAVALSATSNSLAVATEAYREANAAWEDSTNRLARITADYYSASNRAARAEARTAAVITWAEGERDKALLPSTKALWQSFIDKLKGTGE